MGLSVPVRTEWTFRKSITRGTTLGTRIELPELSAPLERDLLNRSLYFAAVPFLTAPSKMMDFIGEIIAYDGNRPVYRQPLRITTTGDLENNDLFAPWFKRDDTAFGTPPFSVQTAGSQPYEFVSNSGAGANALTFQQSLNDGTVGGSGDLYNITMHPMDARFRAERIVLRSRTFFDVQVSGESNIAIFLAVKSQE